MGEKLGQPYMLYTYEVIDRMHVRHAYGPVSDEDQARATGEKLMACAKQAGAHLEFVVLKLDPMPV